MSNRICDGLGSTRLLTNYPTPTVAECDDYYPFGEQVSCGGTSTTTHKFTGYERDTESGLDNAQARYNSSSLGRFMSPDPIGNFIADATNPQSWNMYTYVENDPTAMIDPSGLCGADTYFGWDYGAIVNSNPCWDLWALLSGWGFGGSHFSSVEGGGGGGGRGVLNKIKSVAKSVVCTVTKPLQQQAAANGSVVGHGLGASGGLGFIAGLSASLGLQVVADPHGNVGIALSYSGNPGTIGVLGAGVYGGYHTTLYTSATSLSQFSSPPFTQASFSVGGGAGVGGGVSLSTSPSSTTVTGTVGLGGGPFEGAGALGTALETGGTSVASTSCGG